MALNTESLADSMLKGSDEPATDIEPATDVPETDGDEDMEDAKAAMAAMKHGDAKAFAEAVKRICGHY